MRQRRGIGRLTGGGEDIGRGNAVELDAILIDERTSSVEASNRQIEPTRQRVERSSDGVAPAVICGDLQVGKHPFARLPFTIGVEVFERNRGDCRISGVGARLHRQYRNYGKRQ